MSSLYCTNSVFIITDENNSLSISVPGHWETESDERTFDELNEKLELRSLDLHVKEVRKRKKNKIGNNEYSLSDFDTQKSEMLEELKKAKYNNLEDIVYRLQ